MIITISGTPGSGKSTVAKLLAQQLQFDYVDIGLWRRTEAKNRGMTLAEFNEWAIEHPEEGDKIFDIKQQKMGFEKDNFICDGYVSFHFIPHSLKFLIICDEEESVKRIFKRNAEKKRLGNDDTPTDSIDILREQYKKRLFNDTNRYKQAYGIVYTDPSHFDAVIDSTNLTIEEVVQKMVDVVQSFK